MPNLWYAICITLNAKISSIPKQEVEQATRSLLIISFFYFVLHCERIEPVSFFFHRMIGIGSVRC